MTRDMEEAKHPNRHQSKTFPLSNAVRKLLESSKNLDWQEGIKTGLLLQIFWMSSMKGKARFLEQLQLLIVTATPMTNTDTLRVS